ncbi:Adenine phosphoribosyltransferase [Melia azedarach]|uniref:Adenine phosphoribosyltransferase n=2 Tax=Melia azedarach TaxID=155640 RepID=A0ACC1WYM5_MELAZ|nr:Adenine phosphoribosyltransferase [Melia azedarach]KAJ4703737.1 Adenine phosphoribosyltransferase [Melia azedarach]
MAKISPTFTALLLVLLTTTVPLPAQSLSVSQYRTILSLSHSLLARVANLRAERGDITGANRAKFIAQKLERGLGLQFWRFAWSMGWDYLKNYAWRELDYGELYGAVADLDELMSCLSEWTRVESEMERAAWIGRNYGKVLSVLKRLFARVLRVFRQSGPLREVVETVRGEVLEGDLLRDCLEIGSNDLKGLIQIIKEFFLQYYPTSDDRQEL